LEPSLGGKWLELLSEIASGLKRAAIMFNPDTAPVSTYMPSFETAARSLKIEPIIATVHSDEEIETAITALGREPQGGLVVMPDLFLNANFAVSLGTLQQFLNANGVPYELDNSGVTKTAADIAAEGARYTISLECLK
jgi:putative ABC transport system substrate-binding protein